VDDDLKLETEIDLRSLEDPTFDLVKWYLDRVVRQDMFYKQYLEHHEAKYETSPNYEIVQSFAWLNRRHMHNTEPAEKLMVKRIDNMLEYCAPFPGDEGYTTPIDR
jgi:hypothetical protein